MLDSKITRRNGYPCTGIVALHAHGAEVGPKWTGPKWGPKWTPKWTDAEVDSLTEAVDVA